MQNGDVIRCRVAACRESLNDNKEWSFYLLNDSNNSLDLVVLYEVGYEWGNYGNSEVVDIRVTDLTPGDHALIWRDDGSGAELFMELNLRVRLRGREAWLQFEFLKLYRKRNLPIVDGLGKQGWQVAIET